MRHLDPTRSAETPPEAQQRAVLSRLGRLRLEQQLDEYEAVILASVVLPEDIKTSFADVGGLDAIKQQLVETVLLPLQRPDLFRRRDANGELVTRSLLSPPRGVLFYGPPGTGKST